MSQEAQLESDQNSDMVYIKKMIELRATYPGFSYRSDDVVCDRTLLYVRYFADLAKNMSDWIIKFGYIDSSFAQSAKKIHNEMLEAIFSMEFAEFYATWQKSSDVAMLHNRVPNYREKLDECVKRAYLSMYELMLQHSTDAEKFRGDALIDFPELNEFFKNIDEKISDFRELDEFFKNMKVGENMTDSEQQHATNAQS